VQQVSRAVGRTLPDLVSWEWEKDRRGGLARLDYTQNATNKTLVAPFSPRPSPSAPVSMPITWDELDDPDLRPDRWTIHTALARLHDTGDPLAPLIGRLDPRRRRAHVWADPLNRHYVGARTPLSGRADRDQAGGRTFFSSRTSGWRAHTSRPGRRRNSGAPHNRHTVGTVPAGSTVLGAVSVAEEVTTAISLSARGSDGVAAFLRASIRALN
jgi:hypothetical protein